MSIEHLKQQRKALTAETERVWGTHIGNFPMLGLHRNDAKYVVSTDAVVNDDGSESLLGDAGSGSWIKDVQEFYPGQEIDLLDYIEYVSTEFRTSHIIVFVRDHTGYIERSVTIERTPRKR
jgi:hypothetical protein